MPQFDDDPLVVDDDLRDELADYLGALLRRAAEGGGKTSGTDEQFPHLVAGVGRNTTSFEQPCRVGQRVDQDADHTIFDLPGGQPPELSAIVSCRGAQRRRDVIAIAPALVDRVGWRSPFALRVDQQAGQQARLGGLGVAAVGAGIGRELAANRGPGLLIDQRRMLAWVELTLMRNLTGVNRVRQQSVEMSAREGCATALSAMCRRAALHPQPEAVRCVFDPAHAAELTIQCEDAVDSLGLGRIDDKHPLAYAVD